MHLPIRLRLSFSHLVVLLIGMGFAAVLAWVTVEKLYLDTERANLLAQAELTAKAMQVLPMIDAAPPEYTQALNVQPGVHTRWLTPDGVIVALPLAADAFVQLPAVENAIPVSPEQLLQRPEIQQALHGGSATAVRRIPAAQGQRVLYAAAPIVSDEGSVGGIVYIATPLPRGGLPSGTIVELIGAILAAGLLAVLAAGLFARRIARPIESVAAAAGRVAQGDLDQQVGTATGIPELDGLGQAFNTMTASLQRAERTKDALIADVTHELRTPLTVIHGTVETLEDGAVDDREGRGPLLASMRAETERLIRLVNELLLLARLDAGALKLDLRPLDLGELARSRCEKLAPLAARKRVELHVDEQGSVKASPALGDADRLAQVIDNLLDNAIRFAPEDSTVSVTVRKSAGEIECSVHDRGRGIPAADLPFIFERFYRADRSRDQHTGGSGLGLAIVKALVSAQGGRVSVHSTEGEGATFTFRLRAAEIDTGLPEN